MTSAGLALRAALQAGALLLLVPTYLAVRVVRKRAAGRIPVLVHRLVLRLFRVRVRVAGAPPTGDVPTLILANHVSWLDIPVMSSLGPMAFIAKAEIEGWPVFGTLARLQGCIFLDRVRKAATAEVNAIVADRLAEGDRIVLFPEGTTGDGIHLLPFRSSLVGAARAALADPGVTSIRLQPLAIVYLTRRGLPLTRRDMPAVAWYGDMELAPHLAAFARAGPLDALVVWGEPIVFDQASDRKRATAAAEAAVARAIGAARRDAGLFEVVARS